MKMELITSKIRPIRKLFILEPNSINHFKTIIEELSDEIDGFKNIFLLNDEKIWSSINLAFVKRHDPDFIINFSSLEDALLKEYFQLETVNAKIDSFKLAKYGSKIWTFTTKPFLLNKSRRPLVVSADNSSKVINGLANHYYYRSKALAWYLSQLQHIDPDSLIIGVADHLPPQLDLKELGYEARISKEPYLQIRENIVFMIDKGQWQQFGRIRHKDLFYFILDRLTNHQFCKEVDCLLRDLKPSNNIARYIDDYYAIASQAMR